MKRENIKKSFDNLGPNDEAKERMLNNILNNCHNERKLINIKIVIPVLVLSCIFIGALMFNNLTSNIEIVNRSKERRTEDFSIGTRDSAARITNQFKIENKTYNILSETEKTEFKFPKTIDKKDIGDKITTITTSVDEDLKGKEVYRYLPAGSEAVVAVKIGDGYKLFKFFNFDSYINNQDEDVKTYLQLYGINKGEDISKIQFIGYIGEAIPTKDEIQSSDKMQGTATAPMPEKSDIISEITDREKIMEFYNYYSPIKNSSDDYFNKLFNYKNADNQNSKNNSEPRTLPPDYKSNTSADNTVTSNVQSPSTVDNGETKDIPSSIPGSEGSVGNALGDSVTIRIYNTSGVYFNSEYYPNIGFISRHKVSEEFGRFLKDYIRMRSN